MIGDFISLAWYSSGGGAIGDLLSQWEQLGFFSYLLPFLLIFALIFGILTQVKLFKENKAINAIIALVVGLMALQFDFVPRFFSEIFPRVGIGLAIILVILILAGLFIDPDKPGIMYTLLGVGVVIVAIVLIKTAGALGWSTGTWWQESWPTIIGIILFLVIIAVIVGASSKKEIKPYHPFWPGKS